MPREIIQFRPPQVRQQLREATAARAGAVNENGEFVVWFVHVTNNEEADV